MANLLDVMTAEERKQYGHLIMAVDTNIQISSVILSDENTKKIEQFKTEMENVDKIVAHGLAPMNRLLFYGASGTGKTYLSKALSNYMDYYMLYVDIAQALSDGSVSQAISDTFYLANKYERVLLMYDECDSIAFSRDSGATSETSRRACNSIFQQLDQMKPSVVFISATNLRHRLDPAYMTRFNLQLEFNRPELSIEDTLKKFLKPGFSVVDNLDADSKRIVDKKCRLSYRELTSICNSAMKRAIIDDSFVIKLSDLYADVAMVQNFRVNLTTVDDPDQRGTYTE